MCCQFEITPSSPQSAHFHSIDGGMSMRRRTRFPVQARCLGRRLQVSLLVQRAPASPAVAALTMAVRC